MKPVAVINAHMIVDGDDPGARLANAGYEVVFSAGGHEAFTLHSAPETRLERIASGVIASLAAACPSAEVVSLAEAAVTIAETLMAEIDKRSAAP